MLSDPKIFHLIDLIGQSGEADVQERAEVRRAVAAVLHAASKAGRLLPLLGPDLPPWRGGGCGEERFACGSVVAARWEEALERGIGDVDSGVRCSFLAMLGNIQMKCLVKFK